MSFSSLFFKFGFLILVGFTLYQCSHTMKCSPTSLGGPAGEIPKECYPEQIKAEKQEANALLDKVRRQSPFVCNTEPKPTIPSEAEALYQYTLWHDLHWHNDNFEKPLDEIDFEPLLELIPLYAIAAGNGHYRATERLMQFFTERNAGDSTFFEPYRLPIAELYRQQLPNNAAFNKADTWDPDVARTYADLGVLDAVNRMGFLTGQAYLAEYLSPEDKQFMSDLSQQYYRCAAQQYSFDGIDGLYKQLANEPSTPADVLEKYQQYARFGLHLDYLAKLYDPREVENISDFPRDKERAQRYLQIHNFFETYPFFKKSRRYEIIGNPGQFRIQITDLEKIVPLPPTALPKWDGTFAFQRWYEGKPPVKPNARRIRKMADKAQLHWQTGLPK